MSLKSELAQLHKRYPILTIVVAIIFLLLLINPLYEVGKEVGRIIYLLIH